MKKRFIFATVWVVLAVCFAFSAGSSFTETNDVSVQLLFTADVYGYLTPCG
jgi:tryptophan-rich sensory protein